MLNVRCKTSHSPAALQVPGRCPLSEQTLRHIFWAKARWQCSEVEAKVTNIHWVKKQMKMCHRIPWLYTFRLFPFFFQFWTSTGNVIFLSWSMNVGFTIISLYHTDICTILLGKNFWKRCLCKYNCTKVHKKMLISRNGGWGTGISSLLNVL